MTTSSSYTKPEPVRVMSAVLSGLSFIFGGLATVSGFADNPTIAIVAGVGTLVTGGAALAIGEYTRGKTVPYADTEAYREESGVTVAGPASSVPDGFPVDVVRA